MIKFDRLEKLDKEYKKKRTELIFVSITLVLFIATLIANIIFREITTIAFIGFGVGFLTVALIEIIISFKESRNTYLEEETKVLSELHREQRKMLFNAIAELDKAISNEIAKRKAEQEKAKAEAEKPKEKKKAEPKAKAETKTTKKKN